MPSPQLWNTNWATSIYLSIVYALSTKYNVRRLEDSSYAIWTAILFHLCGGTLDTFLMCPQYGLYISPNDPFNNSIASAATVTDNDARGVFVDNCLILPEVEFRRKQSTQSVAEYFRNILLRRSCLIEADLRIAKARVPVLVEQKRPPPRHCDILKYSRRLTTSLNEASRQAEEQVHCLFSMPKFGLQEDVIAIAASGPWWKLRYSHRNEAANTVFRYNRLPLGATDTEVPIVVDDTDEDIDDEAKDSLSSFTTPRIASAAAKLSLGEIYVPMTEEEEAKLRILMKEQSKSESENAKMREADYKMDATDLKKKVTPKKRKEWEVFVKSVGEGPFTPEHLDKCRKLLDPDALPFCEVHSGNPDLSKLPRNEWTEAMRLGTPVSDQYLQIIKMYLRRLEKSEKARREKAAQDTAGEASGTGGREGAKGGESSKHKEKK